MIPKFIESMLEMVLLVPSPRQCWPYPISKRPMPPNWPYFCNPNYKFFGLKCFRQIVRFS